MTPPKMDDFLKKYLVKYDDWLGRGLISSSSRVVPVAKSLGAEPWVLPGRQLAGILDEADRLAVGDCVCRSHYHRCDAPLDICLYLDQAAEKMAAAGRGRPVSRDEAELVLERADRHGLVHLALNSPSRQPFAFCSCCACCCHDLQLLLVHGQERLVTRSDFTAVTDPEACSECGACVDRCVFGARKVTETGGLEFYPELCRGCGLCVSACPDGAVTMAPVAEATARAGIRV